jgi:hypothetical protein
MKENALSIRAAVKEYKIPETTFGRRMKNNDFRKRSKF